MDTPTHDTTGTGGEKSAIGGGYTPGSGAPAQAMNYNISAVQIGNCVRDGDEFVLVTRSRQGEGFTVWSSADKEVTQQLYKQAASQMAGEFEPAT